MKNSFLFILFILLFFSYSLGDNFNCFTVLVGKDASATGKVLMAHNEDDGGDQVVFFHKISGKEHGADDIIKLKNGAELKQSSQTYETIWLQMPNMDFSDSYINEHGVAIVSDGCPSREDQGVLTEGGIGFFLRKIACERSKTAKEAVKLIGSLIEKYGYYDSGRSYCVADPNEAWIVSVVKGEHWCARRVPDDEVCSIPNYYIIGQVDLNDTLSYLSDPELVEYAKSRGWYEGDGGDFNFRETYGADWSLNHENNKLRHWAVLKSIINKDFNPGESHPFSVQPEQKITREKLFKILRNHRENTSLSVDGNPHAKDNSTVCATSTQYGIVVEFNDLENQELNITLWIAPFRPCCQPFIPIPFGISRFPEHFSPWTARNAIKLHFNIPEGLYTPNDSIIYWNFQKTAKLCETISFEKMKTIYQSRDLLDSQFSENHQKSFEKWNSHDISGIKLQKEMDAFFQTVIENTLKYNDKIVKENSQ